MRQKIEIEVPEGKQAILKDGKIIFEDIFKPKEKTYDDIQNKIMPYTETVFTTPMHKQKCITFRKLLEVANYLNGDWKPDWDDTSQHKYLIVYNNRKKVFEINASYWVSVNGVYFSSEENALKAIEIIGEEELKKLFSNNTSYIL